ncbi:MAG: MmcQ/YjbR family DNA-binding protein [Acidobacteriia bacterium]|nr:MmcQ/YjbR family DNA-binding protein [Terriglobia bacterium]
MNVDAIREFCMSLPHATEQVQWVRDLVFKVGGKMFCVVNLEPQREEVLMSFKATEEEFHELQEVEGIIPAPYMAKNKWVALQRWDVLPTQELKRLVRTSYQQVYAKLPKKVQAGFGQGRGPSTRRRRTRAAPRSG